MHLVSVSVRVSVCVCVSVSASVSVRVFGLALVLGLVLGGYSPSLRPLNQISISFFVEYYIVVVGNNILSWVMYRGYYSNMKVHNNICRG